VPATPKQNEGGSTARKHLDLTEKQKATMGFPSEAFGLLL